jgi:hypothetical protein
MQREQQLGICKFFATSGFLFAFMGVGHGFLTTYLYMRHGGNFLEQSSILNLLRLNDPNNPWFDNPTDWIGLHEFASVFPASVGMILGGTIVALLFKLIIRTNGLDD